MIDFKELPQNIQLLINSYNDKNNYIDMEKLKQKLFMLGYIMDYNLNCEITHLFKVEDYRETNYIKDLELENLILTHENNNLLYKLNKIHHKDLLDVTNKNLNSLENLNLELDNIENLFKECDNLIKEYENFKLKEGLNK